MDCVWAHKDAPPRPRPAGRAQCLRLCRAVLTLTAPNAPTADACISPGREGGFKGTGVSPSAHIQTRLSLHTCMARAAYSARLGAAFGLVRPVASRLARRSAALRRGRACMHRVMVWAEW